MVFCYAHLFSKIVNQLIELVAAKHKAFFKYQIKIVDLFNKNKPKFRQKKINRFVLLLLIAITLMN